MWLLKFCKVKTKSFEVKNQPGDVMSNVVVMHYVTLFGFIKISEFYSSYSAAEKWLDILKITINDFYGS